MTTYIILYKTNDGYHELEFKTRVSDEETWTRWIERTGVLLECRARWGSGEIIDIDTEKWHNTTNHDIVDDAVDFSLHISTEDSAEEPV
jgi:hypothetical protein